MNKKIIIVLLTLVLLSVIIVFLYSNKSKSTQLIAINPTSAPVALQEPIINDFSSDVLNFNISVPNNLSVDEKSDGLFITIGDRILVYELDTDPEKCTGACSEFSKKEERTINNIKMKYFEGYWPELGQASSQGFMSYVIKRDSKYLVLMLQELPVNTEFEKDRKVGALDVKSTEEFNSIVNSIELQ